MNENNDVEVMDDYVIAAIRLALIERPTYGSVGISVTIHDRRIVRIETSRSELRKVSEVADGCR